MALTDDTRGGRLTVRWHPTTRHVDVESSSAMPGANVRRRPFQAGGRRGQRVNVTARALPPGEWTPPYEWEHDLAECSIRLAVSPTSTAEVTVEFSPAGSGPQASPALACEYAERAATILAPKLP